MAQQNISFETELQNLLANERERSNQIKQLYQSLKEDHRKVVEELTLVRQQLREAVSKNEQVRASQDKYIKKLEEQLREKQREIVRLSEERRSYDPNKIKESILKEAENYYEAKIEELLAETDDMKKQYHALHRKCATLDNTLKSRESEYSHTIERLKIQHSYEIEQLQSKLESLEKEKSAPVDNVAIERQSAKHEILQLNASLRALLAECEELRAKNENLSFQMNSINKTHQQQLANNMSSIRNLESEKQKALMQKEVLERELSNLQEHRRTMNNELQANKREILSLRNKLEESEHKYQMVSTDFKIETERLKNEFQFQREQLLDEITRTKSNLRDLTTDLDHTQQLLTSKEQELQDNYSLVQQKLWKQSSEYQQEKQVEQIERKFQDFQNKKDQLISNLTDEFQICQQNLQFCSQSKLELEKELLATKEKLEETLKNTDATTVAKLSALVLEYEQEIHALRDQIHNLKMASNVYFEEKDRMLSDVLSRKKAEKNYEEEREILQLKLDWEQQKHQYHQRLEDLESQVKEIRNSSAAERKEFELKIQRYSRALTKLKEKLELIKAKNEELENLKESLEKNVPLEAYLELKNKLIELKRRHEQYRLVVTAEPHFSSRTPASSEKLLTDIKNLRLPSGDAFNEYELLKPTREKNADKPKRTFYHRRKSLKTKSREQSSKTISPVISSSSDLELENL